MFNTQADSAQSTVTLPICISRLDEIAKATKFIQRRTPGFSAQGFLLSLFKAIGHGHASFQQMAITLGQVQSRMLSRQAIHQRLGQEAIDFLEMLNRELEARAWKRLVEEVELPFKRILLEDSTQLKMHHKNHLHYRAVANNAGPTAGAKLDVIADLRSGGLLPTELTEGHVQDRTLGPRLLDELVAGDLVVRDMGYFDVKSFAAIESSKAFWLSRLHAMAGVTLDDGSSLETLLVDTKQDHLDLGVQLTAKGHRARLIAFKCPQEITARRHAQKKKKRIQNQTKPHKHSLVREGWNIYVTNISSELLSSARIHELYAQRWAIEIRFRALKNSLHMKRALHRITSKTHLKVLVLAAQLFAQLTARMTIHFASYLRKPLDEVSIELVAKWLVASIGSICSLDQRLRFDPRHITPDKRSRRSLGQRFRSLGSLN